MKTAFVGLSNNPLDDVQSIPRDTEYIRVDGFYDEDMFFLLVKELCLPGRFPSLVKMTILDTEPPIQERVNTLISNAHLMPEFFVDIEFDEMHTSMNMFRNALIKKPWMRTCSETRRVWWEKNGFLLSGHPL